MKKQYRKMRSLSLLSTAALMLSTYSLGAQAANSNEIQYSGTLIALPCTVEPKFENFLVEMGEVNSKQLYLHGRTNGVQFEFELKDCDTSLGNWITASFTGNSNEQGLLKFDPISEASGAAIGIETISGVLLPINPAQPYPSQAIKEGATTIKLRAYVQGDSESVASQSITPGYFVATMTYTLGYE